MILQLVDRVITYPMGLLEGVQVKFCGIDFDHSFVVVDFKQETNYEVILGRPFMHQLLVVQDCGYNHLYLHHRCKGPIKGALEHSAEFPSFGINFTYTGEK